MKQHILSITAYTDPQPSYRPQFLISKQDKLYRTYHTLKGYTDFIHRVNLSLECTGTHYSSKRGEVKHFNGYGSLEEVTFSCLSEIPSHAIKFTDLCHDKYVDCYYAHTDHGAIFYKPHYKFKDIFKPLSVSESLEYKRIHG